MGKHKNKQKKEQLTEHKTQTVDKRRGLNITFRISDFCNELIRRLHNKYPNVEWSGIARIEKKKGYYILTDIKFGEQENTGVNTEITGKGLQSILENVLSENPRAIGEYNCWIHSHHSMGVFWSGTDNEQKRSFNDGNTKLQRSVVTAYKGGDITYKCSLNIFKPIDIEFDVPVQADEFNLEEYLTKNNIDLDAFGRAKAGIVRTFEEKLRKAESVDEVDKVEVDTLMSIFNTEDEEDIGYCEKLLIDAKKSNKKTNIANINIEYAAQLQEMQSFFGGGEFEKKITELSDSIIKRVATAYPTTTYKQSSLMEFNNPDYDPKAGAVEDEEEEGYRDRSTQTWRSFEDD